MNSNCCCSKPEIKNTTSEISLANRIDHFLARWKHRRNERRVQAGLYALGNPNPESPVFVTANYSMSFDALRSSLKETNAYIMVLDTKGINVWCAAGKGTFGTDEVVNRIEATGLSSVVNHRRLILPQLGAPGVSAHEVKQRSGFQVEYGPIRAQDIPTYLEIGEATTEMRRVKFTLLNRLVLIPAEIIGYFLPMLIAALVMFLLGGWTASAGVLSAFFAGMILFPILLPWLPSKDFSVNGFILGYLVALPFAYITFQVNQYPSLLVGIGWVFSFLLLFPPITAFIALFFTGATTYTSKSGVEREIFKYIPIMAISMGIGIVLGIILFVGRLLGWA